MECTCNKEKEKRKFHGGSPPMTEMGTVGGRINRAASVSSIFLNEVHRTPNKWRM